jgi:hypothetical protein
MSRGRVKLFGGWGKGHGTHIIQVSDGGGWIPLISLASLTVTTTA